VSLPELKKSRPKPKFWTLFLGSLGVVVSFALLAAFVAFSFGYIATESASRDELERRVLSGSQSVSRLAALEWQRQLLHSGSDPQNSWRPSPSTALSLQRLLTNPPPGLEKDSAYLGSLATLLSMTEGGAPTGLDEVFWSLLGDEDFPPDAKVFVISGLYQLGMSSSDYLVRLLPEYSAHPEPAIRKLVGFGLSKVQKLTLDESLPAPIQALLADPVDDVRWNTALSLLRLGRRESAPVLLEFLETLSKAGVADLNPVKLESAAVVFAELLPRSDWPELAPHLALLQTIRRSHPSLRLRQSAIEALKE
jgi:hypothetical protein